MKKVVFILKACNKFEYGTSTGTVLRKISKLLFAPYSTKSMSHVLSFRYFNKTNFKSFCKVRIVQYNTVPYGKIWQINFLPGIPEINIWTKKLGFLLKFRWNWIKSERKYILPVVPYGTFKHNVPHSTLYG